MGGLRRERTGGLGGAEQGLPRQVKDADTQLRRKIFSVPKVGRIDLCEQNSFFGMVRIQLAAEINTHGSAVARESRENALVAAKERLFVGREIECSACLSKYMPAASVRHKKVQAFYSVTEIIRKRKSAIHGRRPGFAGLGANAERDQFQFTVKRH